MKNIGKYLGYINSLLIMIIIFPFALIFGLISVVFSNSIEKQFKFLKKLGYKSKYKKGYRYYSKNNVSFRFQQYCSYEVKIGTEGYVRIEDTEIGLDYERKMLEKVNESYQNAHPVDIQRGEIDTITPYALFVKNHLKDFESIKFDAFNNS